MWCAGVGVKLGRGSDRGVRIRLGWLDGSHDKKSRGLWLDVEGGARPDVLSPPSGMPE